MSSRQVHDDAAAAEVDEGDERLCGVEAEAVVADEADAAVEALEAAVGQAESDRGEDAVAVAADGACELDERPQPRTGCPCQPRVEMRRREGRILELVEQPQFLFHE